jgi:hypothetical protein
MNTYTPSGVINIQTPTGEVGLTSYSGGGGLACIEPISEIITEWTYLISKQALFVKWGNTEYHYKGVPFSVVHAMMRAESLGKFLNAEVKPKYEAEKWED